MKKTVLIYSLILIAVLTCSFTAVPHVSAQTQNVKILSHSWYIDSLGLLVVVGEVQNTGPNTIDQVILGGNAQGSDGTSIGASIPAYVHCLAPNQKAPFYMEFYQQDSQSNGMWPASDVSNIDLSILQAEPTQNYTYAGVTVQSSNGGVDATGAYMVTGTLKNTGSQTATDVVVIGTYYNSAGTVVAIGYSDVSKIPSLAPSAAANFILGAFDLNQTIIPASQKVASFSLLVQVTGPVLVGTAPIITPNEGQTQSTSTPDQSSAAGPTGFLPGENPSTPSDNTTTIIIVAVVAIAIAVAAVFLLMRKRSSSTQQDDEAPRVQPKKIPRRERR